MYLFWIKNISSRFNTTKARLICWSLTQLCGPDNSISFRGRLVLAISTAYRFLIERSAEGEQIQSPSCSNCRSVFNLLSESDIHVGNAPPIIVLLISKGVKNVHDDKCTPRSHLTLVVPWFHLLEDEAIQMCSLVSYFYTGRLSPFLSPLVQTNIILSRA
jgi:hypothetical protein